MWSLENNTPFAAERTWVRDRDGAETWLVAVKATFLIAAPAGPLLASTLTLKKEQDPVHRVPLFRGDPASTSLLAEADLLHKKCSTDVLLLGSAYAPAGQPTRHVQVRMRVGEIDKTLSVYGDRRIESDLIGVGMSQPEKFTVLPITYERSFGGLDLADPKRHAGEDTNPVGVGFATRPQHVVGSLAPNVEYPGSPYRSCTRGRAAGFGPIARHWLPRRALAGTYDQAWEDSRMPLLPTDFDDHFYQCAPPDQQAQGFLRGGERVLLENLSPAGVLNFALPRITLAFTTRLAGERVEHRGVLHTLLLQPDLGELTLVWHTSLRCHGKDHKLQGTTIRQKSHVTLAGEPLDKTLKGPKARW